MKGRDKLLYIAELIGAYRVVPRIILGLYAFFVWYVSNWYLMIPNPTTGQTALVTTIAGSIPVVIGLYQSSGRNWGGTQRTLFPPRQSKHSPTIVVPPVSPNINIGNEPQKPQAGSSAGRTAGPYDDRDWND
jgi:hypothetical protein